MRYRYIFAVILVLLILLTGCSQQAQNKKQTTQKDNAVIGSKDSNDPQLIDNPSDLMPKQRQQMKDMYNDNSELLHDVFGFIRADDSVLYIQADGHVVYKDKSQKWIAEISPKVKTLCNLEGKDYTNISFKSGEENKVICFLETYYPKTQTMYTILYSEGEFDPGSFWYAKLDEDWYLLETPMT